MLVELKHVFVYMWQGYNVAKTRVVTHPRELAMPAGTYTQSVPQVESTTEPYQVT